MWPWGHLAVAYLVYLALIRFTTKLVPTSAALPAVIFGSQFPDLVDKPLAWTFGILPSGRSLAHSLLTAAVVLSLLYWLASRADREDHSDSGTSLNRRNVVRAFGLGWITHSLSDLEPGPVVGLLTGDLSQLKWFTYLIWPLLPPPPYERDESFLEHILALEPTGYVLVQILLIGVVFILWVMSDTRSATRVRDWLATRLGFDGQ